MSGKDKIPENLCHSCKKNEVDENLALRDGSVKYCRDCFIEVVKNVMRLAEENTKMLKGPDGKKFPPDVLKQKRNEEYKRLVWAKDQLKKLKQA